MGGRAARDSGDGLSRRELIAAGAVAGAAIALDGAVPRAVGATTAMPVREIDFAALPDGPGWGRGWRTAGVANLRREGGAGVLEAGSDVFPNDPRPVAFAVDCRLADVEVAATIAQPGAGAGVVARRTSPTSYYAAVYDTDRGSLRLLRRYGSSLTELAATPVSAVATPIELTLAATGTNPTVLRATLGETFATDATDDTPALQGPGAPGVLATAQTLFPSDPNPVLPALGNLHLLPWSVQEGQAVMQTEVGQAVVDEIRRRSTVRLARITVSSPERPRRSPPAVVAATTGAPIAGGARLQVATDLPARVTLELSNSRRFRKAWTVDAGRTDGFQAVAKAVRGLEPGRRVHWRPRVTRRGRTTVGPVRSFRVLPSKASDMAIRIVVASCGSQFGPLFGQIAEAEPDVFVWQGDLNYPDTHGPLAQTVSGYAGIWRDFLANPLLAPILTRGALAPQRDDHDYGVQDANSTNVQDYPWGLAPWQSLMNRRAFYRFPAGAAEVWVLDQRLHKSDPTLADGPEKTLLGARQRRWLLRTLAASRAPFKVVCSPTTLFMPANARDGNWATSYTAEREILLGHIDSRVGGTTIFLTGDTHLTGVYEAGGRFEARAAPVGIPKPNDITLVSPTAAEDLRAREGVAYASDENHATLLEIRGRALDLSLLREDGARPFARRFA
jgi:hypothetical protein